MIKKRNIKQKLNLFNIKNSILRVHNLEIGKFIEAITVCLKFKKHVIFYYDINIYPLKDQNRMSDFFKEMYKIFPYIIMLTNYVPGYISNRFSPSLTVKVPLFDVFVFLNYDSKVLRHRILINELSRYLYPTVVFSKPGDLDLNTFMTVGSVISNIPLDLTNLYYFEYITNIVKYVSFNILKLNTKSGINFETSALTPEESYLLGLGYSLYIFYKPKYLDFLCNYISQKLELNQIWKVQSPNDFIYLLTQESEAKKKFLLKHNNFAFFQQMIKNSMKIKKLILKLIQKEFGVVFLHLPANIAIFKYK
jgi:hypothetical protein